MSDDTGMRIGEVAQCAGVATSQLRYYERIGVLQAAQRVSGQRRYGPEVLRRLAVIDVAQRAGMSLGEIKLLIEHGNAPVGDVLQDLATRKLPEIDALIQRAQRVRTWLQAAQECTCETIDDCALFDDAPAAEPPVSPGARAARSARTRSAGARDRAAPPASGRRPPRASARSSAR